MNKFVGSLFRLLKGEYSNAWKPRWSSAKYEIMVITAEDIEKFDKRYRVNLINALTGFSPANLIGTRNRRGKPNLAMFSSLVHIGSNPPLMGFINRPDTVARHTLENIRETGTFTVNHVHQSFLSEAHQTSARYPEEVSEFTVTGLTPEFFGEFTAPFVNEAVIKIGLRFREEIKIELNGTHLIIGEIDNIRIPDSFISDEGRPDLERAGSLVVSGLDAYFVSRLVGKFAYAKPEGFAERLE